jgi:hypothetical protein
MRLESVPAIGVNLCNRNYRVLYQFLQVVYRIRKQRSMKYSRC